jgi:DNA polymerase-1
LSRGLKEGGPILRTIITTITETKAMIKRHWREPFAFDVETTGLAYRVDDLVGVALYFKSGAAYYIVLKHTEGTATEHAVKEYIRPYDLGPVLAHLFRQNLLMVAHNAKFDLHFLHRYGMLVQGKLADTLLAAQLLDENRENDLKSLAANMLNMPYAKYQTMLYYKGYKAKEILGAKLEDVAEYAMNDVEATWKLWQIFHPKLAEEVHRDHCLLDVFNDIWMPLLIVLQQMEERGIALDIPLVHEIRKEYDATRSEMAKRVIQVGLRMVVERYEPEKIPSYYLRMATEDDLTEAYEDIEGRRVVDIDGVQVPIITHDMIGKTKTFKPRIVTFNLNSSKQINELVFDYAKMRPPEGVELKRSPKTNEISADKDNLQTLIFYYGEKTPQYIRDLLEYRKADKFIGTYLDRFIADGDPNDHWAIHTWFSLAVSDNGTGGTATGRLSSQGPNLQNIPSRGEVGKRARSMFVARPNYKLVVADLSQAELRMLAHYSQDPALMEAFEQGRDLHIVTGAGLGKMTYEELAELVANDDPEGKKLRMLGKTCNFALTYGMGAIKFQRFILVNNGYEITVQEAQRLIDLYNETYSVVVDWKFGKKNPHNGERNGGVVAKARRLGYVATIYGRKRRLPDLYSNNRGKRSYAERQGINAIIQGSVGDVICEAMIRIQRELRRLGGSILLQVHDEIVCEVPEEHAEEAKELIERLMVESCNKILRVPQYCEAAIGDNWGSAKG